MSRVTTESLTRCGDSVTAEPTIRHDSLLLLSRVTTESLTRCGDSVTAEPTIRHDSLLLLSRVTTESLTRCGDSVTRYLTYLRLMRTPIEKKKSHEELRGDFILDDTSRRDDPSEALLLLESA